MLDVQQITDMHRNVVDRWHHCEVDNPYEGFLGVACQQCSFNFLLWHEEDIARSPDVGDQEISRVKRSIDRLNQQRNDWIEKMDDWITDALEQTNVRPAEDARLNTETPGSSVDRLAIMALRIYHMEEQLSRQDVDRTHIQSVQQKILVCRIQHADLSRSLSELLEDLASGRKRHRTYHQFKMYNDPSLNPYLYKSAEQQPPLRRVA